MSYRLFDFSGDVGIEADAATLEEAFVDLGRAFSHVVTDGSTLATGSHFDIACTGDDVVAAAIAYVNELAYAFDAEAFLPAAGRLRIQQGPGRVHVEGRLEGDTFDTARHASGRGIKAATFHDALHEARDGRHRLRLVLDL